MRIKDLQDSIKDELNSLETLVEAGCKAFSEDSREVYDQANQWVSSGKIALVVVTPKLSRYGACDEGLPVEATIAVRCIEKAALARENAPSMRALDAACIVASELENIQPGGDLDGNLTFERIEQTADAAHGIFTTSVEFSYAFVLTTT